MIPRDARGKLKTRGTDTAELLVRCEFNEILRLNRKWKWGVRSSGFVEELIVSGIVNPRTKTRRVESSAFFESLSTYRVLAILYLSIIKAIVTDAIRSSCIF